MSRVKFSHILSVSLATAMLAGCAGNTAEEAVPVEAAPVAVVADAATTSEKPTTEDVLAIMQASIARAESTDGPGSPALWTLKDDDTTIHMFGTVHILRPETEWRSPAFEAAFAASDKLVLEADALSPEAQQTMAALIPKYGVFTDGQTLNDVLDDEAEEPIVEAALQTFGIPLAGMQPMKPWLVGLQMSVLQMQASGFDPESGIEPILTAEATAAGKSFGYLETAEDQLKVLAGAEMDDQVNGLIFASQSLEYVPKMLDSLVSEWADGDVAGLGQIIAEPEAMGGQDAYDALLVERNKKWVPQIKAMLDEPGTVFVAVGSAHFAGPDSVITMLRNDGLEIAGPK